MRHAYGAIFWRYGETDNIHMPVIWINSWLDNAVSRDTCIFVLCACVYVYVCVCIFVLYSYPIFSSNA
jgi:hypothetical protein